MKRRLEPVLRCPTDQAPFKLAVTRNDGEEVVEGTLTCSQGHTYPITGGIPRLVPSDALPVAAAHTQQSFSAKWRRIPEFGFEPATRDFYVHWYLERYGFRRLDRLRQFLKPKHRILDAGTGLGRDALLYAQNTDGEVFALDISDSVDIAYRHVRHLPNVHVLQADLTALPFPREHFDYIASDQVLHHTPNTRDSFLYLTRHLEPGGEIAVYVYKRKGPIREFCDDFLRSHYTVASEEEAYKFALAMTELGKALHDLKVEVEVPRDIPILGLTRGKHDLQRFIYWNVFKCYWNDTMDFETNVMTNYDWYRPQYAHRHTPEEVRAWCAEAGLEIVHFDVVESGISIRARKPATQVRM